MEEPKWEREETLVPVRQTLGDYCRRTDVRHISPGFQLTNLVTFDIKNYVLSGL